MPESPREGVRRSDRRVPAEVKTETPAQRYDIQRIPEAPLVERKIYVAKPAAVFPTRVGLLQYLAAREERRGVVQPEEWGGTVLDKVPMIGRVVLEDGRVNGALIADTKGDGIGWLQLGASAYEWSTNHVYRPRPGRPLPVVFESKQDAVRGSGKRFPEKLWDRDIVFPLLEADPQTGTYRIGQPLPRTIKTDETFPLWIRDRSFNSSDYEFLVNKATIEAMILSLQFLEARWAKLKDAPERRKEQVARQLLEAQKLVVLTLATGNSATVASGQTMDQATAVSNTGEFLKASGLELYFLNKDINHLETMTNEDFTLFLGDIRGNIKCLDRALTNGPSYSLFQGNSIEKRFVCSPDF